MKEGKEEMKAELKSTENTMIIRQGKINELKIIVQKQQKSEIDEITANLRVIEQSY